MTPEVLTGEVAVADTRADIYTLGAILFQLMSGQRLLGDGNTNVEHVAYKLRNTPVTRLFSVGEDVSRDLETLARQPVRARSLSRTEVIWRWCRRHSLVAALVTAVIVVLTIVLGYVAWFWNPMVSLDLELMEKTPSIRSWKKTDADTCRPATYQHQCQTFGHVADTLAESHTVGLAP